MKNCLFFAGLGWMSLSCSCLQAASINPNPPSALTSQELQFSSQLSPYHKEVFMIVFTPKMRQETITMMEDYVKDRDDEIPMSADMCVEQTLMNHRAPVLAPTKSS